MDTKNICVCTNCYYTGPGQQPGSYGTELFFWLFFIIPGALYTASRMKSENKFCPLCKAKAFVPYDTPRGRELSKETPENVAQMAIKDRKEKKSAYIKILGITALVYGGIFWLEQKNQIPVNASTTVQMEKPSLETPNEPVKPIKTFSEEDFIWDKVTSPYKDYFIKGVNKTIRENEACISLDPQTADVSTQKGTKKDPQFYVYCKDKKGVDFKVYWTKADIDKNNVIKAASGLDPASAMIACKDAVIQKATHPSTVDFSLWDAGTREWGDGRIEVNGTFTAKNSFNLEVRHSVVCLFEGATLINFVMNETP